MPRDSGCYESTENLANGREEVESQPEPKTDPDTETKLNAVQEQLEELKVESPESQTEWSHQNVLLILLLWNSVILADGEYVMSTCWIKFMRKNF